MVLILFLIWKKKEPLNEKENVTQQQVGEERSVVLPLTIQQPKKSLPDSKTFVNIPSKNWEQRLRQTLKAQAGDSLLAIEIKKEKTLIWKRDENPLKVESVIVKLTSRQNVQSSFRALVDPQTGKVLESWDQTIFDPANVKENFSFKLDSRYNQ